MFEVVLFQNVLITYRNNIYLNNTFMKDLYININRVLTIDFKDPLLVTITLEWHVELYIQKTDSFWFFWSVQLYTPVVNLINKHLNNNRS